MVRKDFWGLSEWPASINEHGAINRPQSRGGKLADFGLIKSRYGIEPLLFSKSVTCLIIDKIWECISVMRIVLPSCVNGT